MRNSKTLRVSFFTIWFFGAKGDFRDSTYSCRQNRISVDMSYFLKIAVLLPILSPKGLSMTALVNAVRAIVCFKLPAREASSFWDFWKLTSCDFIAFISSLIEVNFCFFRCACLLRIQLPNLCPNMNHFDAVGFSECHSEEVISFFWCSVY